MTTVHISSPVVTRHVTVVKNCASLLQSNQNRGLFEREYGVSFLSGQFALLHVDLKKNMQTDK